MNGGAADRQDAALGVVARGAVLRLAVAQMSDAEAEHGAGGLALIDPAAEAGQQVVRRAEVTEGRLLVAHPEVLLGELERGAEARQLVAARVGLRQTLARRGAAAFTQPRVLGVGAVGDLAQRGHHATVRIGGFLVADRRRGATGAGARAVGVLRSHGRGCEQGRGQSERRGARRCPLRLATPGSLAPSHRAHRGDGGPLAAAAFTDSFHGSRAGRPA